MLFSAGEGRGTKLVRRPAATVTDSPDTPKLGNRADKAKDTKASPHNKHPKTGAASTREENHCIFYFLGSRRRGQPAQAGEARARPIRARGGFLYHIWKYATPNRAPRKSRCLTSRSRHPRTSNRARVACFKSHLAPP